MSEFSYITNKEGVNCEIKKDCLFNYYNNNYNIKIPYNINENSISKYDNLNSIFHPNHFKYILNNNLNYSLYKIDKKLINFDFFQKYYDDKKDNDIEINGIYKIKYEKNNNYIL